MSVHLPIPSNVSSWPDDPRSDGSWVCRDGGYFPLTMPDGEIGFAHLYWADDVGFAMDLVVRRLNVATGERVDTTTGERDDSYCFNVEDLRLDEARILRNVLSELLARVDRLPEVQS